MSKLLVLYHLLEVDPLKTLHYSRMIGSMAPFLEQGLAFQALSLGRGGFELVAGLPRGFLGSAGFPGFAGPAPSDLWGSAVSDGFAGSEILQSLSPFCRKRLRRAAGAAWRARSAMERSGTTSDRRSMITPVPPHLGGTGQGQGPLSIRSRAHLVEGSPTETSVRARGPAAADFGGLDSAMSPGAPCEWS